MPVLVGIALGSNLGDSAAELEAGFAFLQTLSAQPIRRSSILETAPVDCPPGSEPFLNAVAELTLDPAELPPRSLLARLQDFELQRGRAREREQNAPRALDLDILYYGDHVQHDRDLVIPHPRIATRRFVLQPLAELQPDLVLPGQTCTVRELLAAGAAGGSRLDCDMDQHDRIREIEALAFHLWEREGHPPGRALANWLHAERLLSDDVFLEEELQNEVAEGGIIPPTQLLPPSPFVTDPIT